MLGGKRSVHSRAYTRKSQKRSKFFIIGIILVLVLLGVLSWWITDRSFLVLRSTRVSGNEHIAEEDVLKVAHVYTERSLLFWSRNNFLLVPRDDIEKALKAQFDWTQSVHVEVKGVSQLSIEITEYKPAYLACTVSNACFFMDDTGYIFAQTIDAFNSPYITFYAELSEEDPIGTRIIPKDEFKTVLSFIQGLTDNGINTERVTFLATGETRVRIVEGTEIIFSRREHVEEMLGNFLLLLTKETVNHGSREAFLGQTEYIDVRYGNKVFYKSKE